MLMVDITMGEAIIMVVMDTTINITTMDIIMITINTIGIIGGKR